MKHAGKGIGLWLIGACGAVGSTVALGLAALRRGMSGDTGLVTSLPPFHGTGLVDPRRIVLGGHEVRTESWTDAVQALHHNAGIFDADLIRRCRPVLESGQRNVRPGTLYGVSRTVRRLADAAFVPADASGAAAVERLASDIAAFRRRNRLESVVVIHVASSEPPVPRNHVHATYSTMGRRLARREAGMVPASAVYALAAIEAGCAYVNFTPSPGIRIPAIRQRADQLGLPYMGSDGKTGETLVKSALAPMFAMRNLRVLSWFGQNILGNRDGAVLRDARTRESKIRSKDGVVARIVGGRPETHVGIDFVPSLDDWKIAWDFVHFEGFLSTKMIMQFIWQGSDSVLAAPLIIDLARLAELELRAGTGGPMHHLAFFFKDPLDVVEHDLSGQWRRLLAHVMERDPSRAGPSRPRRRPATVASPRKRR